MYIVHTEASCGWGGQEIRILTESAGMLLRGHRVTLLANPEAPILREAQGHGIDAEALPLRKNRPATAFALRRWIRAQQPDVINTHSSTDAWAAALARIGRRVPVVRTRHISAPIPNSPLSRWLYLAGADRVVTTGSALRDTMRARFAGDDDHFVSVPTGIDLNRYDPRNALSKGAARAAAGLPDGAQVVGIAATLRSWKGHDYLIAAFDQLAESYPDLYLVIVGDGPMAPHIDEVIARCAHRDRIRRLGQRSDVEDTLAMMDVFALPSYANEGVPQAILQAMAMALPVVSTNVGAIGEALRDSETGIMVPPQDVGTLARAIATLLDDPALAAAYGSAGRARVEQAFSLDTMLDRMEAVFAQVAPRHRGGR